MISTPIHRVAQSPADFLVLLREYLGLDSDRLSAQVSKVDGPVLGVVVEEDGASDVVESDGVDVDGGEEVLQHRLRQLLRLLARSESKAVSSPGTLWASQYLRRFLSTLWASQYLRRFHSTSWFPETLRKSVRLYVSRVGLTGNC